MPIEQKMTKKGKFIQKINEAFAKSDINFIVENVTENIEWTAVGDFSVKGKEEFIEALKEMANNEPFELEIKNIITHGDSAAVDGEMKSPDGKRYAFCDVYKFSGFKNPKIKKMTSYVVDIKEN
jgi:hypothetical protein